MLTGLRDRAAAAAAARADLVQVQLSAQLTDLLHELSVHQPLVLLLDDLQWADSASVNLLFHISRCLPGSRLLITGAYRPAEVEATAAHTGTQGPTRHPLREVVLELQRPHGHRSVRLDAATEAERRGWIDALLDSEPNCLDADFRDVLFGRAGAHRLFTVELLRAMQDRGDLIQNRESQ